MTELVLTTAQLRRMAEHDVRRWPDDARPADVMWARGRVRL